MTRETARSSSKGLLAVTAVAAAFASLALAAPRVAHADELATCVKSSEAAQSLRDEGKYIRAREKFLVCSRDVCPSVVRKDCTQWLSEIESSLPSVVISATDSGHDVTDVKVTLDGSVITGKLEGKPFSLDPGAHTLHYEHPGQPPIDDQIVVRAGEKNRLLKVSFGSPVTAAATAKPAPAAPVPADVSRPPSPAAYLLGGVGAVGLIGWLYFGVSGVADVHAMESSCGVGRTCSDAAVSRAKTKLVLADVGMGVGIAGVVSGAIVFFATRKSGPSVPESDDDVGGLTRPHFDFHPTAGGGVGTYEARF